MQPDQQNQTPSSNLNIPDYLQSVPTPERSNKSKKVFLVFFSFVFLLLLAGVAAAVVAWMQDEPERRFYGALESLMSTSYVQRSMKVTHGTSQMTDTVTVSSDFSNPSKPSSELSYESVIGLRPKLNADPEPSTVAGDIVMVGNDNYTSRITSEVPPWIKGIQKNQWYKSPSSNYQPDPLGIHAGINTPLSQVLIGSFTPAQKQQLLSYIRENKIYLIKNLRTETLDGKQVKAIDFAINYKNLGNLNAYLNQILKTALPSPTITAISGATLWVDEQTNRLVKIEETIKNKNETIVSGVFTFKYPQKVSIKEPAGAGVLR